MHFTCMLHTNMYNDNNAINNETKKTKNIVELLLGTELGTRSRLLSLPLRII